MKVIEAVLTFTTSEQDIMSVDGNISDGPKLPCCFSSMDIQLSDALNLEIAQNMPKDLCFQPFASDPSNTFNLLVVA